MSVSAPRRMVSPAACTRACRSGVAAASAVAPSMPRRVSSMVSSVLALPGLGATLGGRLAAVLLPQQDLVHLAGGQPRQLVEEQHRAGLFVARDPVAAVLDHLRLG